HRRSKHRVPIHQTLATIDQAFFVEAHEDLDHRARHARIHREVAAAMAFGVGVLPIRRSTQPTHLSGDGGPGLLLPRPHALDERYAREIVAAFAFDLELALDHDLGGNAGVIRADDPVGLEPAHAVIA